MQEYDKFDQQVHWLSQVMARANRAFVPEKADDSHTNLSFDSIGGRLFGRWINSPKGPVILTLSLQKRAFEWLDEKQNILHAVPVLNGTMEQLLKAVSEFPATMNMETEAFFSPLHFEITDYGIEWLGDQDLTDAGFQQWAYFRGFANSACLEILGYLQKDSEIRIWPHHFDTGIYAEVTKKLGLGFGLAMKDTMVGQPYFYLSGYNKDTPISYEDLPRLTHGHWETGKQWNGAVLPLGAFEGISAAGAGRIIGPFIQEAIDWFINS